jgi:hypothetical protein
MAIIWDKGFKTPAALEAPAAPVPPLLKEEDDDDSQKESSKPANGFGR